MPQLGTMDGLERISPGRNLQFIPYGIKIEETYLFSHLATLDGQGAVLSNHLLRSLVNYQFTKAVSLRAIADYDGTQPNRALIDLEHRQVLTGDVLLTYRFIPEPPSTSGTRSTRESGAAGRHAIRPGADGRAHDGDRPPALRESQLPDSAVMRRRRLSDNRKSRSAPSTGTKGPHAYLSARGPGVDAFIWHDVGADRGRPHRSAFVATSSRDAFEALDAHAGSTGRPDPGEAGGPDTSARGHNVPGASSRAGQTVADTTGHSRRARHAARERACLGGGAR